MERQTATQPAVTAEWNGARYEAYVDREYDVAIVLAGATAHNDDPHELDRLADDGCSCCV